MGQCKIEEYCTASSKPAENPNQSSIFKLPFELRRRIYRLTGLGPRRFINLNHWACGEDDATTESQRIYHEREHECPNTPYYQKTYIEQEPIPISLLFVSRTIHAEVETILYSENDFVISSRGPGGLRALETLSPGAVKALRSITICLESCACLTSSCTVKHWARRPSRLEFWKCSHPRHERLLGDTTRWDKISIHSWQQVCTRLSENIEPNTLTLHLVSRVTDSSVARKILKPLSSLPLLRGCGVSLSDCYHSELQDLARTATLAASGQSRFLKSFRFLDLPNEIQLLILERSPLLASGKLHIFDSKKSYWNPPSRSAATYENLNYSTIKLPTSCCRQLDGLDLQCTCYSCPTSYFLVSKAFSEVAKTVFFSKNHFKLHQWEPDMVLRERFSSPGEVADWYGPPVSPTPEVFTRFFWTVSLGALSLITCLTFVFPPMDHTYLDEPYWPWKQWLETIELLGKHTNLPALTIEIHMADVRYWFPNQVAERVARNEHRERLMRETYRRALEPLKALRGLKALLVYVAWPICRGSEVDRLSDEEALEKMVMGPNYDSTYLRTRVDAKSSYEYFNTIRA
ncbi:MAG: hypothetical protein M1820_007572 [Bogoriella megaspora]|nr:MAG: hypothetical protein M1820_007572 [Bogoriella megaspora]